MTQKTEISWCDYVSNPIVGCSAISPGCANCWAAVMAWRQQHNPKSPHYQSGIAKSSGVWSGTVTFHQNAIDQLYKIKKPGRVFMPSMSDPWHENVLPEWRLAIFEAMRDLKHLTFLVLTKRPKSALKWFEGQAWLMENPLPNLWLGVSIESPQYLDRAIELAKIPVAVRWWSLEPYLQAIDNSFFADNPNLADWIVAGGESGHNARRCHIEWLEQLAAICVREDIPLFVKQAGQNAYYHGKRYHTANKKGEDLNELPVSVQVRNFPPLSIS